MNEFEQLVFNMRTAQKEFFRTRGQKALQTSKRLEKEVDDHLDSFIKPKLFYDHTN